MEILDTLVSREIATIDSLPQQQIAHRWRLIIRANNRDFEPLYIKDVKLDRLYHRNYADELRITVGISFSDYQYNILPYRDTLEATLIKIPMNSTVEPVVNRDKQTFSNQYKVQLLNGNSSAISGDHPLTLNKEMASKLEITEVSMQLFNPVIDKMRKTTFGTVFRDTRPIDAIAYILVKHGKVEGMDAANAVKGVNIDPTFIPIAQERSHIVVPHNTPVLEGPTHIDNVVGGVHPTQMRYYLQSQFWYIYPVFDNQRFKQNVFSLTVIKVPSHRLPGLEKTFRLGGNQVVILSTRATTHQDHSESAQLNHGNGVRFVDARNIIQNFVTAGANKAVVNLKEHVAEFVGGYRKDQSDFIKSAETVVTDKYNKEYAKMAHRAGAYIQTIWENANVDLLFPGMPVRYIFQDGEITKELFGTLNAVETLDYNTNNTIKDPRFTTMALLTLFVSSVSPLKNENADPLVTTTRTT